MDLKQHNPHPRQRSTKRQQTNIHSNNVRRHDSSHNNKHPQSVSHPKPGPTQDPLFFTIFTSQNKVFTQTGNGGRSYQYTIWFTLWTSFNECSEGVGWGERDLGGIPMEGCLLKWIGVGFWHCPFSNLPAHLNKLISLSFSPFSIQLKVDSDKIVQCDSTRPSGHMVPKWRHINVGAKSRRIDINTTSFPRHVPAGTFHA